MALSRDLPSQFDRAKAEMFAGTLLTALNHGALCLMTSVGHRTGLFDVMSSLPPATSTEIAARAGLNERYVREWLAAMATGKVVDLDPTTQRYSLPLEHAAYLTRAAAADNMAVFAQYIAVFGNVEDDIVECFKRGGGVPYARFTRFHEVMAEDSGQSVLSSLESHILPLVPAYRSAVDGHSHARRRMRQRAHPESARDALSPQSICRLDLSPEAIARAREDAAKTGRDNIEYIAVDLSDFDQTAEPETFDFVTTFDAIHDQGKPLNVLKGIQRALKEDGVYLMQDVNGSSHVDQDIEHPVGTFLYTASCMHCMTVSLAQGGEGLGTMWGEEKTRDYLKKAGFGSITTHRLAHDIMNNW